MVSAETDNLEDLFHEIEDKDLNIVNISFRTTAIREVHCNKIVHNMVAHVNRISKGTKEMHTEAKAGAGVLNNLEDAPMASRTIRITLVLININTTDTTSDQNSMSYNGEAMEPDCGVSLYSYRPEIHGFPSLPALSINFLATPTILSTNLLDLGW